VGLFGACLLYGDGMITPAISVMSAIEGIKVITVKFEPYIIPLTVIILAGLFMMQSRGTGRVGALFGPVIFVWFCALGVLGLMQVIKNPHIFLAFFPWYGIRFLIHNHVHGFLVLGAIFLVVTGAEALYADMGHFGRFPIRLVWSVIVLPALLLNYFGQGALLLVHPEQAADSFYALVPSWAMVPMVILATMATIIASQAVISGAFSLTRQAALLGYFPRLRIIHTSAKQIGQIYVPAVNWILMISTIGLAIGFHSSTRLAAAYGVAVTSTMLISTILFYVVAREKWRWKPQWAIMFLCFFIIIDVAFFLANISKIMHGAWFPLVIGAIVFILMTTWRRGREIVAERMKSRAITFEAFQETLSIDPPHRVNGQAVFLTGNPGVIPISLLHNLKHNKILHAMIVFLHFKTREVPRIPNDDKVELKKLGGGFYEINAHYGFMEQPNIKNIFSLAREKGLEINIESASFFLGHEELIVSKKPIMQAWRIKLFAFMSRNSFEAVEFFQIPPSQTIELGVTWEL